MENEEMSVCTPCEHGVCPGSLVKIICVCRECRHEACEVCVGKSKEKGSGICCMSCVPTVPAPEPFLQIPWEETREAGGASKDFEHKFERVMAGNVVNDSKDSDLDSECSAVEVQSIDEPLGKRVSARWNNKGKK
jgi:hypothetical protein